MTSQTNPQKIHLGSNSLICPKCSRRVTVSGSVKGKSNEILLYSCGHTENKELLRVDESSVDFKLDNLRSLSGKELYKYQKDGVKHCLNSNGRSLIADEVGLGKTIQALATIRITPEMMPFLVICKSGLKIQWVREIEDWLFCVDHAQENHRDISKSVLTIEAPELLLSGFNAYVASYDIWAERKGKRKGGLEKQGTNIQDVILRMGIKTIILDEVQQIKNSNSARTKVIRKLCSVVKHVIELSATPFKNNAGEYFNALNIIQPRHFPTETSYILRWVAFRWTGGKASKMAGINNPEAFKEFTKDFIIRRERSEVLPDLPNITRNYTYHDLGAAVEEAYQKVMKEFLDDYDEGKLGNSFQGQNDLLTYLVRMRHLTGLSKIDNCIDSTMEFVGSCDRKLVIFLHHKDVANILANKLNSLLSELDISPVLSLSSDLNGEERDNIIQQFKEEKNRILIASTLASGEGLNLQFCSDCIMLERQWNPANEEQAEGRFTRIGQRAEKCCATYIVAIGTIDEFFADLVENKRRFVKSSMQGISIDEKQWNQQGLLQELREVLASKGRKKWSF